MARIREYELDRDLEINDKVLGTDGSGFGTMNFSIEQLGEFLASRGLADPSALDFQFQHVERVDGSISEGGISYNSTAPIELTSVYIGATDLKGLDTEPFAAVLVGTVIEINDTQASQGTDYGFYDVTNSVAIQGGFELTVVLHEAVVDLIESTASVPQTEFINISIIGLTGSTGDVGPVGFTPEITDNGDGTAAVGYVRVTNAPAPSSITLPIGPQGFSIDGLSTQYMGGDGLLDTTPELGDDTIITLSLDDVADTDLPSFTIPGGITGMVGPQGPVGEGTHGTDINVSISGELLTITETEYASPTDTVGTTTTIVDALDIVGADGIDGTHGTDVRASRNGDLLTITQTVYANASDTVGATTDIFRDVDIVGDDGAAGLDGRTLLSGAAAPVDSTTGEDGDFYIQFVDADSTLLFGPRTSGLWGTGIELQGTDGATFDPATLTGDITATTAGVVTIVDDSHNHIIANVDGLQDALDIRPTQPATPATTSLYNLQVTDGGVASFELLASDLPDSPSGIAEDTVVNYNLTLTDVSGTETLTWTEDTGGGVDVVSGDQVAVANGVVDLNLGLDARTIPLSNETGNGLQNSIITEPIGTVVGANVGGIAQNTTQTATTINWDGLLANPASPITIGSNVRVTSGNGFDEIGTYDFAGVNPGGTAFLITVTFPFPVTVLQSFSPIEAYTFQEVTIGIDIGGELTLSAPGFTLPGVGLTTLLAIDEDGLVVEGTNATDTHISVLNSTGTDNNLADTATDIASLNFTGATVTDDGSGAVTVAISTSGATIDIQDEGTALTTGATTLNFTGDGVSVTGTGATKTVNVPGGGTGVEIVTALPLGDQSTSHAHGSLVSLTGTDNDGIYRLDDGATLTAVIASDWVESAELLDVGILELPGSEGEFSFSNTQVFSSTSLTHTHPDDFTFDATEVAAIVDFRIHAHSRLGNSGIETGTFTYNIVATADPSTVVYELGTTNISATFAFDEVFEIPATTLTAGTSYSLQTVASTIVNTDLTIFIFWSIAFEGHVQVKPATKDYLDLHYAPITVTGGGGSGLTLVTEDTGTNTVTVAGDLDIDGTLEVNLVTATDQPSVLTAGSAGISHATVLVIGNGALTAVLSQAAGNAINAIVVDDDEELYATLQTAAIADGDAVTSTVFRLIFDEDDQEYANVGSTRSQIFFETPFSGGVAEPGQIETFQFFAAREVSADTITFVDDVEFLGNTSGVTAPADHYAFYTSGTIEFEETISGVTTNYHADVAQVKPDIDISGLDLSLLNTSGYVTISGFTATEVTNITAADSSTTTGRKYFGVHGVESLGFAVLTVADNQTNDGTSTGTANATGTITFHTFYRATNEGHESVEPDGGAPLTPATFGFGNRFQLAEFENIVRANVIQELEENPLSSTSSWVESPGEVVSFENLLTETIFRTDGSPTTSGDSFRANVDEVLTGLSFSSWNQTLYGISYGAESSGISNPTQTQLDEFQETAIESATGASNASQILIESVQEQVLLDWITSDQAEGYVGVVPTVGNPAKIVAKVNDADTLTLRSNVGGDETNLRNDLGGFGSATGGELWDVVLDIAWGSETEVTNGVVTRIFSTDASGISTLRNTYDRLTSTVSELADVRPDVVDQTYDATSADAQSGTAVSQAIAGNITDISTSSDATQVTITETFVDGSQQTSFIPGVTSTISGVMLPAEFIQLSQLPDAIPAAASTGTSDAYLLSISDARAATWTAAPAVPSNNNQLTNGAGFVTGVDIFETGDPSSPVSNIQNIRFVGNGVDLSVEGSGGNRTAVITIQQSGSGVADEEVENVALSISGFDQHEAAGAQTLTYSGTFTISAGLAANLASDAFTVTLTAGGSDVTITQSSSGNNYTYAGTSSVTFDATNSVDFVFSVSVEDADGNTFSGAATESLGPVAVSRAYTSTFTAPDSLGSGRAINNTADFSYIPNSEFTVTSLVGVIVGASNTDLTPTRAPNGVVTVSSGSLTDITTGEYTIRFTGTFTETAVPANTGTILEAMTFDVFNSYFTGVVNTDPGAAVPSPYSGLTQSTEAITRGTQATFAYSGTGGATQYFIIVLHNDDLSGSEVTIAYPDTPGFILTPDIYTGATHTTLVVPFNQGHTITINI